MGKLRWNVGAKVAEKANRNRVGTITDRDPDWYESDPDDTTPAYQVKWGEADTYWVPQRDLIRFI